MGDFGLVSSQQKPVKSRWFAQTSASDEAYLWNDEVTETIALFILFILNRLQDKTSSPEDTSRQSHLLNPTT